jgi:hypothetical protein
VIAGLPVQVIPAHNKLAEEAVDTAALLEHQLGASRGLVPFP